MSKKLVAYFSASGTTATAAKTFVEDYDTIFLGFPIWWYVAPTIINTFLESYDFTGKTIILFATSGGSDFGGTVAALKDSAPGAVIREGKLLNGRQSKESLAAWIDSLNV
ncbi:MAG: hypothetical protein K2M42_00725 [Oscillospiraceae bacterium]|nr:hypothetical protein [Oscillospiraceae bacterium]